MASHAILVEAAGQMSQCTQ